MNQPTGIVEAILAHELRFGSVLPLTAFRFVSQRTHTYAEGIQAVMWVMGIALEVRYCPEA